MKLPHGTKKPEWSWFPGHVRHEDVWDASRAIGQQNHNLNTLIEDALPLWNEHTLNTLLGFFAENVMDRDPNTGAISIKLRKRVSDTISSVSCLQEEKRDALMGLLDRVPKRKQSPSMQSNIEEQFAWTLGEFITPQEDRMLREWFHSELDVKKDTLRFEGPFLKNNEHVGHHWPIDMRYMKCNGNGFQWKKQGTVSFGYPPTWWWDMIVRYKGTFYRVG